MSEYHNVCDQCGRECGIVCRDCLVCPEPAGYWAWDDEQAQAYLAEIDLAAEGEQDVSVALALGGHHSAMRSYFETAGILRVVGEEG